MPLVEEHDQEHDHDDEEQVELDEFGHPLPAEIPMTHDELVDADADNNPRIHAPGAGHGPYPETDLPEKPFDRSGYPPGTNDRTIRNDWILDFRAQREANEERRHIREEGNLLRWRPNRKEEIDALAMGFPNPKPFWWDRDINRFAGEHRLARTQPTEDWTHMFRFAPNKLISFFKTHSDILNSETL